MKKFGFGLVLAILIQSLAGISTAAAGEIKFEIEDYIKEESSSIDILPGGTGNTTSSQPGNFTVHNVYVDEEDLYSLYIYGACIADIGFKLDIDGTNVTTNKFSATCTDWSVYAEVKIADIKLTSGMHSFKLEVGGGIALDYAVLRKAEKDVKLGKSNIVLAVMAADSSATENNGALTIDDGGYAEYSLVAEKDMLYTLKINAASVSESAELEITLNDETIKTTDVKNTLGEENFAEYFIMNLKIPSGTNKFGFKVNGGSMSLKYFALDEFNKDNAFADRPTVMLNAVDYLKDGQDISYHDSTPDSLPSDIYMNEYFPVEVWDAGHAYIVYSDATEWYTFDTTVPEDGEYDVYIHLANENPITVAVTTEDGTKKSLEGVNGLSWTDYAEDYAGSVKLKAGKQIIRIDVEGGDGNIAYYKFVKRPEKTELYGLVSGADLIVNGAEINRGTEVIEAYFTDILKANGNVSVTISDGEKVLPVSYEITSNEIKITLLESLQYEKEYTIDFSGVYSEKGNAYVQTPITFKTGTAENDKGTGKFISGEASINGNTFTISGAVATENGIKMAGRGVYATFKNGTTYTSDTVYSEKDGKFNLTYELPEDAKEGEYAITVFTDYASRSDRLKFDIIYMSQATEEAILTGINSAESWEDVKTIIENDDYYKMLALTGKSYVKKLDNERFYKHFLNRNYVDKDDVIADYNKFLAFERINQEKTSVSSLKTLLKNKTNCEHLGIDNGKVQLLSATADEFYSELLALELYDDADMFTKKINAMLNAYMIKEFGITTPELLAENVSVYVGKSTDISIGFKDEPQNVSKVVYKITGSDEDIIENTDCKDLNAEKDGLNLVITTDNAEEIKITLSHGTVGTYNFKVSATVEYAISDTETCIVEVPEKSFTAEIKTNSSSGTSGGGGGSGSGSGKKTSFSPVVVPATPSKPVTEPEKNEFKGFSDIADVEWAKESINRLVEKNVIAKDEKFRPNDYITREEFVKMAVTAFNMYDKNAKAEFTDVKGDEWFAPYIASAFANGIVTGNPDGSFGIGKNITRQEIAVILCRILNTEISEDVSEKFADDEKIADWAKEAVYEMKKRGIVNGVGENTFEPESYATRAMAARMIDFMMNEVAK